MNPSRDIKQLLTMRQVAEYYGFSVPRSGFIKCPFHRGDRTASLKIYEGIGGWYCFGCQKGGSVVDFVMELFGLTFKQAMLRLNSDFRLGLYDKKPNKAAVSAALEARRAEQREKEQKEREFRFLVAEMWYWKEVAEVFEPNPSTSTFFHPLYVEAVKRIPLLEYQIDIRLGGDFSGGYA